MIRRIRKKHGNRRRVRQGKRVPFPDGKIGKGAASALKREKRCGRSTGQVRRRHGCRADGKAGGSCSGKPQKNEGSFPWKLPSERCLQSLGQAGCPAEKFPEKIARKTMHMPHMRISIPFILFFPFMITSPENQKTNFVPAFDLFFTL